MGIKKNKLRKKNRTASSNKEIILVKSGKNRISFSRFPQIIEIFEKRDRKFSNLVEKSRPRSRLAEFPNSKPRLRDIKVVNFATFPRRA